MMKKLALAIPLALLLAGRAAPQPRGGGRGESATALPAVTGAGPREERADLPGRDLPIEPRHGLLGAPGAALDRMGSSRLGPSAPLGRRISYGQLPPGAPLFDTPSGDLIRSWSSSDVREARKELAPDVQIVGAPQRAPEQRRRSAAPR
jgi:hypothetical protein